MSRVDLTPKPYQVRCRARAAVKRWLLAVSLCTFGVVLPLSIESARPPDHSAELAHERMVEANERVTQTKLITQSLSEQLLQSERELQAEMHLTRRPDWSMVLTLVASQFDSRVMMTGFRLGPLSYSQVRTGLGEAAQDVPADSVWVILTGVASENSDVPGLILRLESLGLFERVIMTETQRQTYAGGTRSGFVLACRVQ